MKINKIVLYPTQGFGNRIKAITSAKVLANYLNIPLHINWIKEERRDSDIHRSSTVHYPDWNTKKKEYIVPPNQRKGQK